MRGVAHVGLRLRDQLLAFASVRAVPLLRGQLAPLAHTFSRLRSLSLSGKVALDGRLLRELMAALSQNDGQQQRQQQQQQLEGMRPAGSGSSRLLTLSLDVHFVGVSPLDMRAALALAPALQVRLARGRCCERQACDAWRASPNRMCVALAAAALNMHRRLRCATGAWASWCCRCPRCQRRSPCSPCGA
jgi:hypothetical protein